MGFLVLTAVGSILGWLAAILSRSDDRHGIALNVAVGVFGALAGGAIASSASLIDGLSATALGLAFFGAVLLLGGMNLARSSHAR